MLSPFPRDNHNECSTQYTREKCNLSRVEQVLEFAQDPRALPSSRLGIDEDEQRVRAVRRVDLERSRPSLEVWSEFSTPFPFRARLSLSLSLTHHDGLGGVAVRPTELLFPPSGFVVAPAPVTVLLLGNGPEGKRSQ